MYWNFFQTGEFYSLLCAFLWAIAVILFRKTGEYASPVALNLFKGTVGLGLFLLTLPAAGISMVPQDISLIDWATLLASGFVGIGIADTLFLASLNRLGAMGSAVIDCLFSPFVVIASFFYLKEPIGPTLFVAMSLMSGAILLAAWQPDHTMSVQGDRRQVRLGAGMGILSMMLMAVGIVMAKPVLNETNPAWATTVRLAGGMVLLMLQAAMPVNRAEVIRIFRPGRVWLVAIPAATVGTYLAVLVWTAGMKYTYTTTASVLNQASNVFILPLAAVFLKERLDARKVLAILMGVTGSVLIAS